MADFRQLALEFVLADDEVRQTEIARKAAGELENAAAASNPVARWVEAVQPWMPGSSGAETEDGDELPDWTSRAKALEFLSRSLDFLKPDVLKPSQVKLLVAFFGAMFEVDHKAGILPSATALTRLTAMKSFQPTFGNEIITKLLALKDDFPRQVAKTRLVIYNLIHLLMTTKPVASDLQNRHGSPGFMPDLIQLCGSERDPECLMAWFAILRTYIVDYSPSKEMLDEVYDVFKPYFPIALPRASQTTITPEDLKLQLRKCFAASYLLADKAFTFLVGKLDQGDAVTVNVKIDILKTIRACLDEYSHPEEAIHPYVNQIWGSLKYEVRNGEIEDTIWGTLEVLKSLTLRLQDDSLRDYTLNATRDCVTDLANPTYTAPAGRLLVSVLSSKPSAFVLMAAPVITHIKENLRHPKSPMHSQELLKILNVILETRLLLSETEMSPEDREDFAAIDSFFKTLYEDVFRANIQAGSKPEAEQDDHKKAAQAVQGAGVLACQRRAKSLDVTSDTDKPDTGRLLSETVCTQICETLFDILVQSSSGASRSDSLDELIDATTKALQRVIRSYPSGFKSLVDHAAKTIQLKRESGGDFEATNAISSLGLHLAFVGCSELPQTVAYGFENFLYYTQSLLSQLFEAFLTTDTMVWCALVGSIQTAIRYFHDACLTDSPDKDTALDEAWIENISTRYPELSRFCNPNNSVGGASQTLPPTSASVTEIRNEFLLVSLFVGRLLYRKATKPVDGQTGLTLSDNFIGSNQALEHQYLHLVSALTGFVIHELSESQQLALRSENFAITLFQEESIPTQPQDGSNWDWLVLDRPNILSLSILEALRPSAVSRLLEHGVAQGLVQTGSSTAVAIQSQSGLPVTLAMLSILANKLNIEADEALIANIEQRASDLLSSTEGENDQDARLKQLNSIYALVAGMVRRYRGKEAMRLIAILRALPRDPHEGRRLCRGLEMIVAPQRPLTKENYAIVKPLWMPRVYFELASPMLEIATGADPDIQDPLIKMNFSIAVLLMVKHMSFAVYESFADKMLRISIFVAQTMGVGPDVQAALDVLKTILVEAPETSKGHVKSIIKICVNSFSNKPGSTNKPEWVPETYVSATSDPQSEGACGKLALEIVGGLPRMIESQHLVPHVPQVQRELTLACGHRVRDLRRSARLARAAWAELK